MCIIYIKYISYNYLTPCVGWYSPPEVSVASERKFEITVFPLCGKQKKY